ncbi:MAG: aspartate aminotransferase family protein [Rhodothermales bacterium]|nr:aspartate aminotransferase family protein [Rhodothermales bacterium]
MSSFSMDYDLPFREREDSLAAEQRNFLFPCVRPYYQDPLVIRRAEGVWVYDDQDRPYLDLFAGILTTSLGHAHPEIVARVREQVGVLSHASTLYITEPQIRVAQRLAELAPGRLQRSLFLNSGTAAIDAAVMLARMYTGRDEIIALRLGYSGNSLLATNLTAHAPWRPLSSTVPGIKHALAPYPYRSPFGDDPDVNAARFADDIENIIQTVTNGRPAALLAETILGVGGFIVPPPGYFQRAAEIVRSYGGLFICDEVQTGFGRTGDHWFGIEHWEVEPDIMVVAKGIANGFPVGAVIARPDVAAAWEKKMISTFGGNPVCMAAAEATLDVMVRENVPARAAIRGRQLRGGLDALQERYTWVGDVRGMGLMQGMELVTDRETKKPDPERAQALLHAAKAEGLLIGLGGLNGHVIRIGPSLLITEAEIDEGLARLGRACGRLD